MLVPLVTYKGFVLMCTPIARPNGKFTPHLVIKERNGRSVLVHRILLRAVDCNTEAQAETLARVEGRKWADEHD